MFGGISIFFVFFFFDSLSQNDMLLFIVYISFVSYDALVPHVITTTLH